METQSSISSEEFKSLQVNEACVIQEFSMGSARIARLAAVGTKAEMDERVEQTTLLAVPVGMKFECQAVHKAADILGE